MRLGRSGSASSTQVATLCLNLIASVSRAAQLRRYLISIGLRALWLGAEGSSWAPGSLLQLRRRLIAFTSRLRSGPWRLYDKTALW